MDLSSLFSKTKEAVALDIGSNSIKLVQMRQAKKGWELQKLGLAPGQQARIRQGEGEAKLEVALDDRLPDGCIRVAAGHPSTAVLGAMFGALGVEKVSIGKAA